MYDLLLQITLPGVGGGIALFLWGLRQGSYRNNKYSAKFTIEAIGAGITATCLFGIVAWCISALEMDPLNDIRIKVAVAFAIGLCWVKIIQVVRERLTKIIEGALG